MSKIIAVVTCIDFRLHGRKDGSNSVGDFMGDQDVEYYLITRAGVVLHAIGIPGSKRGIIYWLSFPVRFFAKMLLLWDIGVAISHGASEVLFLFHEDCKAWNGKVNFLSLSEERKFYRKKVTPILSGIMDKAFPNIPVKIRVARHVKEVDKLHIRRVEAA